MAFCRTEQFEVSPLISGLTPWGHNKKKEQMQTRCLSTADQCKQTGREKGPRLRRNCLISEFSYGLLTSRVCAEEKQDSGDVVPLQLTVIVQQIRPCLHTVYEQAGVERSLGPATQKSWRTNTSSQLHKSRVVSSPLP